MLKRVHVAGVLALGLSGFAAAQTTTDPAALAPDQAPPETGTVSHQPGNASFLTPKILDSTLTRHLAGAALLLHQEAPLWPRVPSTTTIPAPVPEVTADQATTAEKGVAGAPVSIPAAANSQTSASAPELLPQAAAPARTTFNENTNAVPSTVSVTSIVKAGRPEVQAELNLPALPSAALTGSVVDLALAPATPTQAGSQLARLRLLQAQNPRRPSAGQAAAGQAQAAPLRTVPPVQKVAPVVVRPATVRAPTPEVAAEAAKPTAARPTTAKPIVARPIQVKVEQAIPAPIIVVNVRVPAVSTALSTSARKAPAPALVKTAAPVKQIVTAAKPPVPTEVKPAAVKPAVVVKPAAVKPATVKPAAVKPAPTQRQAAAPSSGPVVGATRGNSRSLGRPVASGARRVVSATAYSSDVAQTDSTPFVTATGTRVRPGVIALSRDLLRTFPYGSRVTIQDAGGVFNGRVFIVEDTMNARLRNTIDVWMGSRRQAYQWGRRTVTITAVR